MDEGRQETKKHIMFLLCKVTWSSLRQLFNFGHIKRDKMARVVIQMN